MRKAITLLTALTATAILGVSSMAGEVNGSYTGTAKGFGGEVSVTITLEDGTLTDASILGEMETPNVGGEAMKIMQESMIGNQTVNVDAVAGATFTSTAVVEAVQAAVEAAGLSMEDFPVIEKAEATTIEKETGLLIIGGGGSGLTAGNSALEAGLTDVTILEKMAYTGGATSNAGGVDGGMSKLQEELGMTGDSYDQIFEDIMASGESHDEELVRIFADNMGATLDWMIETEGLPFTDRYASDFPEHTVQRFFVCEGGMSNAMSLLTQRFVEHGGNLEYNTRATELIQDENGAVVGAIAEDIDGNTIIYHAKAVVIATGGYGANQEMISSNPGDLAYAVFYGVQSSMGDGQKMGEALGTKMLNMGYAKMYPNGISLPGTNNGKATPMPTLTTVNTTGAIFVNKEGQRFINETVAFADIKDATTQQTDKIMYILMDQAGFDTWSGMVTTNTSVVGNISAEDMETYFDEDSDQPMFSRGTLEEVAADAGIDLAGLQETVEAWNATVESGEDTAFGRTALFPLDTEGTLYLIEQKLRFATTLGGFDVTANFECQLEDGTVIPGLYAVGECVGGPNGTEAIPGSMAAWAVTSGHLCGQYLGGLLAE